MATKSAYKIAVDILSDTEKNRLLCVYLNSEASNQVDWKKATADYGAASVESMKICVRNIMKKIAARDTTDFTDAPPKPVKKRKAAAESVSDADHTDSKARKGKNSRRVASDDTNEDNEDMQDMKRVKMEKEDE